MTPEQLKKRRKTLGFTQEGFAIALGYNSGRYIRALESGERAITPRTVKLIEALGRKEP